MKRVKLFADGASRGNPGPSAIGIVLCDEDGHVIQKHSERITDSTYGEAEYRALIKGLELAERCGAEEVYCYTDSPLVFCLVNYDWKVKNRNLQTLRGCVIDLKKQFKKMPLSRVQISNEMTRLADCLASVKLEDQMLLDEETPW